MIGQVAALHETIVRRILVGEDGRRVADPAAIGRVAEQLGVSEDEAAEALAQVLPHAVDHVTPQGQVPDDNEVESALDQLKGLLG